MGIIAVSIFVFWYTKRIRRRRRSQHRNLSEKDAKSPQEPTIPQFGYRMTISSFTSSLKRHHEENRSSRGSVMLNANKKKSSWAVFSKRTSNEPVELPDISTCPYAYTNEPHVGAGGQSPQEEIPIGISPVGTCEMSSESCVPHRGRPSRSSSVMIMYVKSWLPGASSSNNGRTSVPASSALRKGSTSSTTQRAAASTYESRPENNYYNQTSAYEQHRRQYPQGQQQQEQYPHQDFSPVAETSPIAPARLYDDRKMSWASTASSMYSDMDDISPMTNTTSRKSAPRIPNPPNAHYR